MVVCPTERYLQDIMKLGYRAVASHQQATPDLGTDLSYPDTQLIHLNCLVCTFHPTPLLDSSSCTVYVSSPLSHRGVGPFACLSHQRQLSCLVKKISC